MPVLPVQIIPPTFADGYCPPTLQQFANDFASGSRLSSSITLDKIVISDSAPSDHTKLWYKTVGGLPYNLPPLPIYFWHPVLTAWVAAHPDSEGDYKWQKFTSEAQIWSYQGGSGLDPATTDPTDTTGSFWKLDHDFDGRSPMSPGAIPSANPAKTLGFHEEFGKGAHMMTSEEVGPHRHPLSGDPGLVNGDNFKTVLDLSGAEHGVVVRPSGSADGNPGLTELSILINKYAALQQAMPVVHPVRGMACIVRTQRIWYVG